jgi:membrane protein DedA with SNARE-associated domain
MCGITLSYAVGRRLGPSAVSRFGRWFHVSAADLRRVEAWFERSGKWMLTFGYFVPGVRHVTALVAGSSQLPPRVFAIYAYAGAAVWSLTFITFGWGVGHHWEAALRTAERHILTVTIVLALAATTYAVLRARGRG